MSHEADNRSSLIIRGQIHVFSNNSQGSEVAASQISTFTVAAILSVKLHHSSNTSPDLHLFLWDWFLGPIIMKLCESGLLSLVLTFNAVNCLQYRAGTN